MANRRLRKELLETVRGLHEAGAIDVRKMEEFETFRVEHAPGLFLLFSAQLPDRSTQRPARTSMNRRRPASR